MSFCTAINCIDGRAQTAVIKFLRRRLRTRYVDLVTEPGAVRVLSEQGDSAALEAIIRGVQASVRYHESRTIAVVAHHDCAANPLPAAEQQRQVVTAIEFLGRRFPEATMLGLWVNERWRAEIVPTRAPSGGVSARRR